MSADNNKTRKKKNKKKISEILGFEGKTIWDWLRLLIVPIIISFGGLWFTLYQRNREKLIQEHQRNRELEVQRIQIQEKP